jgi:diguanylate cyclase (GGDEF)-like protein
MQSTTAQRGIATLKEGALSAGRAHSVESFLGEVVEQLARLVDTRRCSILLVEGNRLRIGASTGLPDEFIRAADGLEIGSDSGCCGAAAHLGETVVTEDIATDPRWSGASELALDLGLRSCWSVPLRLPDGTVLGTFATYREIPHAPDQEQIETLEAYASIVALGVDSVRRKAELAASYESAVLALTSALDVRDDYTGSHSNATSRLVRDVCARLGLGEDEAEMVSRVAALHDVGKLGVPTDILTSPAALTEEQERIMRDHPVIGEQILRQIPGMDEIAKAVRHEHERWDGAGYPDGLSGTSIPLASRIVFACDAFHAMTSDRPYRPAMDRADAIAELRDNAGSQFDPQVVEALLAAIGDDALIMGCAPGDIGERDQRLALEAIASELGAEDVFVFRKVARDTFAHLAGIGRGEGWAGNIELRPEDGGSGPSLGTNEVRVIAEQAPVRVVGPYYARSAVIVPCGHEVIVVFGSLTDSLAGVSARDMTVFGERVARLVDHVPSAKRLADELEVLDAVRAVTTVNADGVEAALSEISQRAANALSCEFGAVVLTGAGRAMRTGWADLGWTPGDPGATRRLLGLLAGSLSGGPGGRLLIQDTSDPTVLAPEGFGSYDRVASLQAVPIGTIGLLITVHAQPSPRGFTNLCQRVARSVADGAEHVIRRALAQEALATENAKLERRASTDGLTGLNNRGGWDDALIAAQIGLARDASAISIALFDLDGLKTVNDTFGHAAGDSLIRAFGEILATEARAGDYVARIGGDEFAVLLNGCDDDHAEAWCRRVVEAVEERNSKTDAHPVRVSWGCATAEQYGSISAAVVAADRSLYGDKAA